MKQMSDSDDNAL